MGVGELKPPRGNKQEYTQTEMKPKRNEAHLPFWAWAFFLARFVEKLAPKCLLLDLSRPVERARCRRKFCFASTNFGSNLLQPKLAWLRPWGGVTPF